MRTPKGACVRANGNSSSGASIGVSANLLQVTQGGRCNTLFIYGGIFHYILNILKTNLNQGYAHANNY